MIKRDKKKIELLVPAGDIDCVRAAVQNRADSIYIGLKDYNARLSASNIDIHNLKSITDYCHAKGVKVYVTLNTLVKNKELKHFFSLIDKVKQAKADAVIIQDLCLSKTIKDNFLGLDIHASTQSTITNSFSIPKYVDRTILARELSLDQIKKISKDNDTEIFVHGALCISYSGQCLFSSIAGGRSANRGVCAQPCRKLYNNRYLLSTMDLCMIEKIPDLIKTGVSCLKIEGRMRSPLYVSTVSRIYRKAIDSFYDGNFRCTKKDIEDLKQAFNREFTKGFAYENSITATRKPMNRGLYLGTIKGNKLKLNSSLKIGDGISLWQKRKDDKSKEYRIDGYTVNSITIGKKPVKSAKKDNVIDIISKDFTRVYKTFSVDLKPSLGPRINLRSQSFKYQDITLPNITSSSPKNDIMIHAKVYNKKLAIDADNAKADIIYYDLLAKDCLDVKKHIKSSRFFVHTPRILYDEDIPKVIERIEKIDPDGILLGDKSLLNIKSLAKYTVHLDYSFNIFNDLDMSYYKHLPIISPELSLQDLKTFKDKNFIALVHGDIILMTTKQKFKAPELVDDSGRHFRIRESYGLSHILNSVPLGMFNRSKLLKDIGVRDFLIDTNKDIAKFIRIYKKILSGKPFKDKKISKGHTTGNYFLK